MNLARKIECMSGRLRSINDAGRMQKWLKALDAMIRTLQVIKKSLERNSEKGHERWTALSSENVVLRRKIFSFSKPIVINVIDKIERPLQQEGNLHIKAF